jgi:hypothetical protein
MAGCRYIQIAITEERPIMARETQFPLLSGAQAHPSEDGQALLIEGVTFDREVLRFALALPDVGNLIGFLLSSLGKMARPSPAATEAIRQRAAAREPVPISSFSVADVEGGGAALVFVGVGPTELVFSLPAAAFDPIGRAMLVAGAKPSSSGPL